MDVNKYLPMVAVVGGIAVLAIYLKNNSDSGETIITRQPRISSIAPLPGRDDSVLSAERVERARIAADAFNTLVEYPLTIRGFETQEYLAKKQKQAITQAANYAYQASYAQSQASIQIAEAQARAQIEAAKAQASAQKTSGILGTITSALGPLLSLF